MKFKIYLSKLIILFIAISLIPLTTYSNNTKNVLELKISIKLQNAKLTTIFSKLKKENDINFSYGQQVIEDYSKYTVDYKEIKLINLLNDLASKGNFKYQIVNDDILIIKNNAQQNKIAGKIKDANGLTIPGATISEKGTTNATISNAEGAFSLALSKTNATLVVSFTGYKTKEINLKGETNITISLIEDVNELEDVVIIGYGSKSKQDLINAVSSVDLNLTMGRPVSNIASSLQGVSPGLNITQTSGNPSSNPSINIRGFTSINGGGPLVIIDGAEGDLNNLNPNDIESISVLKDAGASAIYGGRAAFGVVLVTTKEAKKGEFKVNINSSIAFSTPTINTDFVTDPFLAANLVDESFRASNQSSYTRYTDDDYEIIKQVSENPSLGRVEDVNGEWRPYASTDWWDFFFRQWRPTYINDVSVSGGSDKVKTYLSYRNYENVGILKVQDDIYKKNNLRGKIEIEVNDWLSISNNMQFNNSNDFVHGGNSSGWRYIWNAGSLYYHALPSYSPVNPDGTSTWLTGLNNYDISNGVSASLLYGKTTQETKKDEFSNIATVTIKPFANLVINANYNYRKNSWNRTQRSTRIPYSLNVGQVEYMGKDQLIESTTATNYNSYNVYANYENKFGDHSIGATVGFNREEQTSKNFQASKLNSISDELNSLGLGTSNTEATGSGYEWALMGGFYRLSYDFKSKYLLELNGRYDGSSRFPKEDRWGFFPSVAAGWIINNEDFFKIQGVNLLKLRASYGSLGNQEVGNYAYTPTLSKSSYSGYTLNGNSNLDYIESPSLAPANITWEKVNTLNLGVDLAMLGNKLNFSLDMYERNTLDMLTNGSTLPSVLGAGTPKENVADLETQGFEISLGYNNHFNLAGSPFKYGIAGTLSNSKTVVNRFNNENNTLLDFYEGMEFGELWGYKTDGLFQTDEEIANHADQSYVSSDIAKKGGWLPGDLKYLDVNGDGVVDQGENTLDNHGDKQIIGNVAPKYLYSFSLNAQWKGFDLSAFFQGVGKQDWYPTNEAHSFWAMYNRPYVSFIRKDMLDQIWSPENTNAYFPRLRGYIALAGRGALGTTNDRYLQSIAYLRLKNLTFGYTIPSHITDKIKVDKLRFYFSGENLLTFTKLTDYIDPEAASMTVNFNNPSVTGEGGRAVTYPFGKTYSFGISVQF